jgi:hypothetical protein
VFVFAARLVIGPVPGVHSDMQLQLATFVVSVLLVSSVRVVSKRKVTSYSSVS